MFWKDRIFPWERRLAYFMDIFKDPVSKFLEKFRTTFKIYIRDWRNTLWMNEWMNVYLYLHTDMWNIFTYKKASFRNVTELSGKHHIEFHIASTKQYIAYWSFFDSEVIALEVYPQHPSSKARLRSCMNAQSLYNQIYNTVSKRFGHAICIKIFFT